MEEPYVSWPKHARLGAYRLAILCAALFRRDTYKMAMERKMVKPDAAPITAARITMMRKTVQMSVLIDSNAEKRMSGVLHLRRAGLDTHPGG